MSGMCRTSGCCPRAAAVVHHVGAGITATALQAAIPSVPLPMHTDQPFWARRLVASARPQTRFRSKGSTAPSSQPQSPTQLRTVDCVMAPEPSDKRCTLRPGREGGDLPRPGGPWPLPLQDRVLLVAAQAEEVAQGAGFPSVKPIWADDPEFGQR